MSLSDKAFTTEQHPHCLPLRKPSSSVATKLKVEELGSASIALIAGMSRDAAAAAFTWGAGNGLSCLRQGCSPGWGRASQLGLLRLAGGLGRLKQIPQLPPKACSATLDRFAQNKRALHANAIDDIWTISWLPCLAICSTHTACLASKPSCQAFPWFFCPLGVSGYPTLSDGCPATRHRLTLGQPSHTLCFGADSKRSRT